MARPAPLVLCGCWLLLGAAAHGARILAAVPLPSASHFRVFEPLLLALSERGHHVTVISHYPQAEPRNNYTDISLAAGGSGARQPAKPFLPVKEGNVVSELRDWAELTGKLQGYCRAAYSTPAVRALLDSDQRFDLVLAEVFASDCMAGLAGRFQAPLVGLVSSMALPWALDRMGNPDHPAYMENFFLPIVAPFGFWERTANTLFYVFMRTTNWWISERAIDAIEREALGESAPATSQLVFNTSLILLNSHHSMNQAVPMLPGMVEVGGMHLKPPKALPKELQEFMDSSEHGVIYFSMGTLVRSDSMPADQIRSILRAFASLPQRVLWKVDSASLPPLPPNVRTSAWLPQNDILNHPKLAAFITHGGLLGLQEAVGAGVPLLVVPVMADQLHNAALMVRHGVAEALDVAQLSEHSLRTTLHRLVNDTSYRRRMKQLSALFRDRPRPPLEEAVYWVEYVLRHRGAGHLRSAALDLAWYQYLLLDVVALVVAAVLAALGTIYVLLYWMVKLLPRRQSNRQKAKTN